MTVKKPAELLMAGWIALCGVVANAQEVERGSAALDHKNNLVQGEIDRAAIPTTSTLRAAIYRASNFDEAGDASKSIEQYQQSYDAAKDAISKLPAGSREWIEYLRAAADAGYILAWYRWDQGDKAAGDAILKQLTDWLAPFDKANPIPQLRVALSRVARLNSRIHNERSNTDLVRRLDDKVLILTSSWEKQVQDYGPMARMRIVTLWGVGEGETLAKNRKEACRIAAALNKRVPGSAASRLIECAHDAALSRLNANDYDETVRLIDKVESIVGQLEKNNIAKIDQYILLVEALGTKFRALLQDGKLEPAARTQLRALSILTDKLKTVTFSPQRSDQIWNAYEPLRSIDFTAIPEFSDPKAANRKIAVTFTGLMKAVQPSFEVYKASPPFAAVVASASSLAANAHIKLGEGGPAIELATIAINALERADILGKLRQFDEQGAEICQAYGRAVEANVIAGRSDTAIAAYRRLQEQCGAWLRRYPWDFYARQHMRSNPFKLGELLAKEDRAAEAAPLLRYASDWGHSDATRLLVTLLKQQPQLARTTDEADMRETLAKGQSMKRFTVPTQFGATKFPFHVYLSEYGPGTFCPADRALKAEEEGCVGFLGIDDQAMWVKEARGGVVPDDAISAFRKLNNFARDNKISFPDFAAYALVAASAAKATPAQAAAIHAEMQRTGFWRNPYRPLDEAGLAIEGRDIVSYTQGDTPKTGSADHFLLYDGALWLFANAENRAEFLKNPGSYLPRYGGFASSEMAQNTRSAPNVDKFLRKNGALYLFHSDEERTAWNANTEKLAANAQLAWLAMGQTENATEASEFTKAILAVGPVRKPNDIELMRYRLGRLNQLVAEIEARKLPNEVLVSALGSRSWSNALNLRRRDALADAERALALDPDQPWIIGNRANALLLLNRRDEALAVYKSVESKFQGDGKTPMCDAILDDLSIMGGTGLALAADIKFVTDNLKCRKPGA
ncbi:hypothetical protein CAP39_04935 [Sphingomonas sp. IBVSS1]|nr:hypothetical protein CAP39_04935 [Sphingomonas sp. IBVSS1]